MLEYNILVINPGSTSDEVSYYRGEKEVFHKTVRYSPEDMKPYDHEKITAQFDMRKRMTLEALKEHGVDLKELSAVIGRGGRDSAQASRQGEALLISVQLILLRRKNEIQEL